MTGGRHSIVIVGGGASGVLLTAHLLRDTRADVRVTLIERRSQVGRGIAYSAIQLDHILNVPASGMSAFADDPEHFLRWLGKHAPNLASDPFVFAPRRLYGEYLAEVLADAAAQRPDRLTIIAEEAVDLVETASGVDVRLANGISVPGHLAVLAVGHEEQPARGRGIAVRVGSDRDTPLDPDVPVMMLGSGLSMVDAWLRLDEAGHRGPIYVVSRHGLLPRGHARVAPVGLDAADVPFGTSLRYFTRWFRGFVAETVAQGGDWRAAVDALRPFNQLIWQNWSNASRRQFIEHLRPWWNVHRHRLPPEILVRMSAASNGQVRLIAGKFLDLRRNGHHVAAIIRRRGAANEETVTVGRVYDCGGVSVDVNSSTNPVISAMVRAGVARADGHHLGLDVTVDCRVVGSDGKPSERLFAAGPLTRGQFWEIESVPDIRLQISALAGRLGNTSVTIPRPTLRDVRTM